MKINKKRPGMAHHLKNNDDDAALVRKSESIC